MVTKPSVKAHNIIFLFISEDADYLHMTDIPGTLLNLSGVPKNDYRLEEIIITREKTKMYMVRSLSMTNWLCSHGHQILKVEDSEKDSRFKVFLFEDTAALHNTMKQFPKGV